MRDAMKGVESSSSVDMCTRAAAAAVVGVGMASRVCVHDALDQGDHIVRQLTPQVIELGALREMALTFGSGGGRSTLRA